MIQRYISLKYKLLKYPACISFIVNGKCIHLSTFFLIISKILSISVCLVKIVAQYCLYLSNPLTLLALENMICQVLHKLQILYSTEMVSSLLSSIFKLSTSCFFDRLSGGFGGGLNGGTKYGGSISLFRNSIIDLTQLLAEVVGYPMRI